MRSSFGHLEGADLALVDERLGVFSLPTPRLNRNTPLELCAQERGLPINSYSLLESLRDPFLSAQTNT
jgi:hypothetical protein